MNTTLVNPFAHLIVCKHCGKTIQYQAFAPKKNVQPRIHHRSSLTCKIKSAPFEQVQDAVIQGLKNHIADFEFLISNDGELQEQKQREEVLESMKAELEKLKKKKAELYDLLEDDTYTKEEFRERKEIYTERIEKLISSIEAEEAKHVDKIDYQEKIVTFRETINSLSNPDIPAKRKNDLMKAIVKKIEYDCVSYGHRKGGKVTLDIHLR
jgi:DNA repair exonuclease SbcCD ATPase subunit